MIEATPRPDILLIHWSDLGRNLGAYGVRGSGGRPLSPHLDRLAGQGIRFDRAFATAPLCSPARSSLFTGLHPQSTGLLGNAHLGWSYRAGRLTLPMLLQDAGYHTVLAGLQHEGPDPYAIGFAESLTDDAVRAGCEQVVDATIGWLRNRARRSRPLFLSVGFYEVHRPFSGGAAAEVEAAVDVPGFLPDNAWTREDLAAFHAEVLRADRQTGRLLAELERLGLADTAWIVFTTDHGMAFPRAKSTLYDPGIEVALVMRPPRTWARPTGPGGGVAGRPASRPEGRLAGRATGRLVSHVDLVPTILEALALPVPPGLHGVSHARWLAGHRARDVTGEALGRGHPPGRSEIFAGKTYHDTYDPMRCVRTTRWKYIRNFADGPLLSLPADIEASVTRRGYGDDHLRRRPAEELYDLRADPWERENLADDPRHEAVRAELAARLARWQRTTGDPLLHGPVPAPATGA